MKPPIHLLVRASAGTGKTQMLSNRYLELLLDGVDPDRILATTFTRKAAHEILDRILGRLADAATDTEPGRERLEELRRALGRPVSPPECLAALERLLRGMDRVRIGTIDSFFAQLARLFALDLGLPAGWRIADEAESELLRSEAVADAVAGAGPIELLDLLRDFQKQAVGQGAHEVLLRFAQEGREKLLESRPEAWTRIRASPEVEPGRLAAAVAAWPRFPLPKTKTGKPRVKWAGAQEKFARWIEQGDWFELLESTLAQRTVAEGGAFDSCPLTAENLEILGPLVAHALHLRTKVLELQNAASRALLERYERSYQALTRARGQLRFEDLPNALAPVSREDPLAARGVELADRIDGKIDHLLLDEFQDTAPVQWRVLRPIADGILADASGQRSFFCVGDEKQSIYGWRAAEPGLLRGLDRKRPALKEEKLDESYRSSRAVLGSVNLVFGSIADNPSFEKADADVNAAAREIQSSFREHRPAREKPGAAFLVRTRTLEEGEPEHVPALEAAVERVSAILDEAPRATVGVLVRVRKRIPDLIRRLRDEGIRASDQGGNPLTDSIAVLHALSLLHLADHPGDTAAAFHVAKSPLARTVGLEPKALFAGGSPENHPRGEKLADPIVVRAGAVARGVRAKLAELGFGGYLASIRPSEGYTAWDLERYGQLVDLALAWESRAGSRAGAFVEHVRKTKVEDRSAAQVRVMTVHGAKGLEFDAVVLPDLDRSMRNRGDALLSLRPDPEGPIEIVSHGIAKAISPAHADLERVRSDVVRRDMVEELCVLYVAMTRAVHRLDMIVRGREKKSESLTNATILRQAFEVDEAGPVGVAWSHRENSPRWFSEDIGPAAEKGRSALEGATAALRVAETDSIEAGADDGASRPAVRGGRPDARTDGPMVRTDRPVVRTDARSAPTEARVERTSDPVVEPTAPAKTSERPSLRLAPARRSRSTASRSPSQAKDLDLVTPSWLLQSRETTTARGRIVHRLLEEVEWLETFDRSDEELLTLALRLEADKSLASSSLAEFRASLARPETKLLLSKPAHDTQVWRERRFSLLLPDAHGSETLWNGAFDRVVLRRESGKVVSAEIIDFKTDRIEPAGIRGRAETYRPQMLAYRQALARITGLTEGAIRPRLAFLAQDAIEDLQPS